ncbi:DUF1295 domain-containing protein [Allokutzneria albata]|uniref:Steroid 5-alpha reductase family enzyme n=1 Tax=Allokutzneria albata TaxID=211114 RepID=A0A1H0DP70_ALLAB|nr:DUF1295 domain-containing protein [Allokutzneria albata]SDN71970.1 Steroid 5-alpha reductase family enzyme [Allokutzneria albata]
MFLTNLAVTGAVTVLLVVITYAIALRRRRLDTIDTFWGLGFAVIAVTSYVLSGFGNLVITALTVLWGVRLAWHIHARNHGRPEDPRYTKIRGNPFYRVYLLQAVIMWFVSLPVQAGQYWNPGFGLLTWLGVLVWTVGFVFETVGDRQLARYKADPHRPPVLDTGLWRYTRHPNYFGDACVWAGLYLMACSHWIGAATVLSPVVMILLLVKGSGAPLTERAMADRPGYAEYVSRTSGFVPLPPRKDG